SRRTKSAGKEPFLQLFVAFSSSVCIEQGVVVSCCYELGLPPVKKNENKEGSSLTMLLEKQGHGSEDQHPGNNNVSSSSFSTREEASVKPKIA
ncbi:unnamed protein product, partial [Urochloa humidicola]